MRDIFDNSYARLPDRFYTKLPPVPVTGPQVLRVNDALARKLGLDPASLSAEVLTGNALLPGTDPLAQVYAGHQFGGWVPRLGDGRAILLGEVTGDVGRRDIQLKGSGITPYSRNGDGRAWVGPVMREYIVSEAMHALGIPTTRALGAALTGEGVQRERRYPGAVLMRVAASHIRVGTFQYFAARGDRPALRLLLDHAIARHYPDADGPLSFLAKVVEAQARLVAKWMSVGFIHGVMNTDNMAVSGETIDYGPCAFMDTYHPRMVFSSIDQQGRYAFQEQPNVAVWNLAQLATSLLPLMDGDPEHAADEATRVLEGFADHFSPEWMRLFRAKVGLTTQEDGDEALITGLLSRMASSQADFTATFTALTGGDPGDHITDEGAWDSWAPDWQARLAREPGDPKATMRAANPVLIPRNHRVEQAIQAGIGGDYAPFHRLVDALARPFDPRPEDANLATPPRVDERVLRTFCGT
ncbi:protein adenylyltransferase SelO [Aliiroseovarius sediminis]|uniref:protein adenylyltransferase SelO n=1 Tax=Aliiroseovarius sediminis TaxID=2925839 RepID=UPI001F57C0C8|nr:YdiU family protein [Aliiroseovarius sediminis]MCI2393319.1 YdiU family protein [Aliiroseovarius sediminis]